MVASDGTVSSIHAENGSDSGSAGLLESMGQLQDARLSKSRSEDLQAHGQLSVRFCRKVRRSPGTPPANP